jgi:hypothetical protein
MAQYEQKTDSREFEVANPDQYPNARGGDVRADATEIAIRLWGAARNAPLTWKADSVLVYMIADLVAASGGCVADTAPAVMTANFDGSRQALVASKRIQTSLLEFVACRPGERVGAAILIYQPRSSELTGFSAELAPLALEKARPGQILLPDNVYQRLRDLPGVECRTVSAQDGEGQTGLVELLWTTPEQLALLRDSVGEETQAQSSDRPPVGATMMVDSPFARRGPSTGRVAPAIGSGDFIVKEVSQTASQRASQIPQITQDRAPVFEGLQDSPDTSLTEGLDEFGEQPFLTRTRVILGVVALVLVGVVIAVFFRPTPVAKHPLPLQPDQTVGAENPDRQPAPVASEPETKKPPETEVAKPQAKVPAVVARPPALTKATPDSRVKNKKDNAEEPAPVYEYGGFSQKDIPMLLQKAQSDTGKGDYVIARREYDTILQLAPNNQEARDGLKKLDMIHNERQ